MSAAFDPYHKWLAIPPQDQPPHFYRLLGLQPFEADLQLIETAANKRLVFLRKTLAGEHAVDGQKLLDEVARARICLLKPTTKQTYDAELREQLGTDDSEPEAVVAESSTAPDRKSLFANPLVAISVGAVLLLAMGGLAFFVLGSGPADLPDEPAEPGIQQTTQQTQPEPAAVAKAPEPVTKPPTVRPAVKPDAAGKIDIIPLLLTEDILKGRWKLEKDKLESLSTDVHTAQVQLPVDVPQEYTLYVSGTRIKNPAATPCQTLGVGVILNQQQCLLAMDTQLPGGTLGIQKLDDRVWNANPTTMIRPMLTTDVPFHLQVIVRDRNIEVRLDERTILDWHGESWRLQRTPGWDISDPQKLFIAAATQYVFTGLTLGPPLPRRVLPGRDLQVGDSAELLKFVDLKQDVWNGEWLQQGQIIASTPKASVSRFNIRYDVPEEYELVVDLEGEAPGRGFYLVLPVQTGTAGIGIGGVDGLTHAFLLDPPDDGNYPTNLLREPMLVGKRNKIVATVRQNHLIIKVGEKTLLDWVGDPRRLMTWWHWGMPGNRIGFGSNNDNASYRIHSAQLTRLAPAPDILPETIVPDDGNLLAIVDVRRDTRHGTWIKTGDHVRSATDRSCRLAFPAKLPVNYEFRLIIERKSGSEGIQLTLPVAGRAVMAAIENGSQKTSGIEWIEGKRCNENSTTIRSPVPLLPIGQRAVLEGQISGKHFKLLVNQQKLFDLDIPDTLPNPSWIARDGWLTSAERLHLCVQTWLNVFEIHEFRFRPLVKHAPPFPPLTAATPR